MQASETAETLSVSLGLSGVRVADEASRYYTEHADALALNVTDRVLSEPAFQPIRHALPRSLLHSNHRNHAYFMGEILRTSAWAVLERTLPWVYHSHRGRGVPYEYFCIELSAWKAALVSALGPSPAAQLVRLYDAMLTGHEAAIAAAERFARARAASVAAASSSERDFLKALLAADPERLLDLSRRYLAAGHSFVELLQQAFRPALVEIGACWADGTVSVAQEHQATAAANCALSSLYVEQPLARIDRGCGVVATASGDHHQLGAWMVAAGLEADGWEIRLLSDGLETPQLGRVIAECESAFIALSATMLGQLSAVRQAVQRLRALLPAHEMPPIIVGGQALAQAPELFDTLDADVMLLSIDAVTNWVRPLSRHP